MSSNEFIEEDWERLSELDKMYLYEKHREMEEEWHQWEEKHKKRLPAKIKVIIPKPEPNEQSIP